MKIQKLTIQKLTIAGKKYEYPDTTALVGKINELVDAVNELQLVKDVMFNRIDMLNNAICDIRNRITTLDDPTYHQEAPADNSEKANCQENVQDELERTRKALDRAKWWLHEIVESHRCTPISTAEMALEEITALEQKDKL